MNLCLVQLILSGFYVVCFFSTVIYMLIINRCKFNKRTKIVIWALSLSIVLQECASILTYVNMTRKGVCAVYPLAYTILSQQHIIIIIIYSFLLCRMCSIYQKMTLVTQITPSWKSRWARYLS